jgi:uncharacterized DUF497 family protein
MKNTKNIRNGSLYFNERKKRVERVLGKVNSTRVWTASHERGADDVRVKDLRMAQGAEVESYLEESVVPL